MENLSEKNLSLISFGYPHHTAPLLSIFVKERVDYLKEYFEYIDVYALSPRVSRPLLKAGIIDRRWSGYTALRDYSYENVRVHYVKRFDLPLERMKGCVWGGASIDIEKRIERDIAKPILLDAHFIWPCGYVAAKIRKNIGTPLVITSHGYDAYDIPSRSDRYLKMVKFSLENADVVIAVSEYLKRTIVDKTGLREDMIQVIPNGLNSEHFKPINKDCARKKLALPLDREIVLTVGNLSKIKGHLNIIETFFEYLRDRKNLLFIFVGGGTEERNLRSAVNAKGIGHNFMFAGEKSREDLPLWINACDLYLHPSLNEGFGIAIIEAMACGKPVVATRVGAIPEIVNNTDLGTLVDIDDKKGLSLAIIDSLEKTWNAEKIITKGRSYRWSEVAKKTLAVYEKIL